MRDEVLANADDPCSSNTVEVFVLTSDSHEKNRNNCIRNPNLPGVPIERFISYTEVTEEHRTKCRIARSRTLQQAAQEGPDGKPVGCPDPFPLGENVMSDPDDRCDQPPPAQANADNTFCDERDRATKCYQGGFNDCLIDLLGIDCKQDLPLGSQCCVNPIPDPQPPGDPQRPNPGGPGGVDVAQDDQDNPDVPDELEGLV